MGHGACQGCHESAVAHMYSSWTKSGSGAKWQSLDVSGPAVLSGSGAKLQSLDVSSSAVLSGSGAKLQSLDVSSPADLSREMPCIVRVFYSDKFHKSTEIFTSKNIHSHHF